jgi:hypothetical protein
MRQLVSHPPPFAPHPYNIEKKRRARIFVASGIANSEVTEPTRLAEEGASSLHHRHRHRDSSSRHQRRQPSPQGGCGTTNNSRTQLSRDALRRSRRHHSPHAVLDDESCQDQLLLRRNYRVQLSPKLSQTLLYHDAPEATPSQEGGAAAFSLPTSTPSDSRSKLKRLLRQLEDVAAQAFRAPERSAPPAPTSSSAREGDNEVDAAAECHAELHRTKALYQALFLQALEDGVAWERHARVLADTVHAHEKREAKLLRQLQRARQDLALLAAYMEGADRVAGVVGVHDSGGGTVAAAVLSTPQPTRASSAEAAVAAAVEAVDMARETHSTCATTPTTKARTKAASSVTYARSGGGSPLPQRLPSHSAVSDLICGSLGRSLNLADGTRHTSDSVSGGSESEDSVSQHTGVYFTGLAPGVEVARRGYRARDGEAGRHQHRVVRNKREEEAKEEEGRDQRCVLERCFDLRKVTRLVVSGDDTETVVQPDPAHAPASSPHPRLRDVQRQNTSSIPQAQVTSALFPRPSAGASVDDRSFPISGPTGATRKGRQAAPTDAAAFSAAASRTPPSLRRSNFISVAASPFISASSAESSTHSALSDTIIVTDFADTIHAQPTQSTSTTTSLQSSSRLRTPGGMSTRSAAKDLLRLMRHRDAAQDGNLSPSLKTTVEDTCVSVDSATIPRKAAPLTTDILVSHDDASTRVIAAPPASRRREPSSSKQTPLRQTSACSSAASHPLSVDYEVTVNSGHPPHDKQGSVASEGNTGASSSRLSTPQLRVTSASSSATSQAAAGLDDRAVAGNVTSAAAATLLHYITTRTSSLSEAAMAAPAQMSNRAPGKGMAKDFTGAADAVEGVGRPSCVGAPQLNSVKSDPEQTGGHVRGGQEADSWSSEEWESVDTSSTTEAEGN